MITYFCLQFSAIIIIFAGNIPYIIEYLMPHKSDIKQECLSPHPGAVLLGELSEHDMSQRELAVAIGKTPAVINGIIKGERDINSEIALLLEAALPGPLKAEDWMRMQCAYDLDRMRGQSELEKRRSDIMTWGIMKALLKLKILKKKLDFTDDIGKNIALVFDALGVSSLDEFQQKVSSFQRRECFKKSDKVATDSVNLMTWLVIVRHKSNSQRLEVPFHREAIPHLKSLLNQVIFENSDTFARTEELCNQYGIKFIRESKLDKVPVDGYSFWMGDNPTIVMTGRMDRIDNFAFTLMHELGHIELHLTKDSNDDFVDIDPGSSAHNKDVRESQATSYATESIWQGEDLYDVFWNIQNPFGAAPILKSVARRRRMNPGVVVGQYRHFCMEHQLVRNPYAICHELIERVN